MLLTPGTENEARMWAMMEELFPVYRCLCGPGFKKSLEIVSSYLPLEYLDFPSDTQVFDWKIPKECHVREAYVIGPDGKKYLDFAENNYHLWLYSQPFDGEVSYEELLEHVTTYPALPDAIPLKPTYYRPMWGFCASQNQLEAMPKGTYRVHIDTEHTAGFLRMGEHYLPGESDQEIMITSYLCHPQGANDNLSGVVVATELFQMLAALPKRRYSYRLVIWPETIGSITYIYHHRERLKKVLGGYVVLCVGAGEDYTFKRSFAGTSIIDRAAEHALRNSGFGFTSIPYDQAHGSDERQFNMVGLRLPFSCIMRGRPGFFKEYHSSADNLQFVRPANLADSLKMHWDAVCAIERTATYRCNSVVEPFLTAHGIYPFRFGSGGGRVGNQFGQAYYYIMGADGERDLLQIADDAGLPITAFDPAVEDFLKVGLLEETGN